MANRNRNKRPTQARAADRRTRSSRKTLPRVLPLQWLSIAAVVVLAVLHQASVVAEFRMVAGLHRWLMTYAEGFHRRGLVGTIFQFLVGHQPREAQIVLASQVSEVGTYLWLFGAVGVFVLAAARLRNHALGWAAVAFAAFAFINPMWTTRAFDNGYLDWLVGIVVVAALAALAYQRPVLSGALVAAGIAAYWGTIFVWLPVGLLTICLLVRDTTARDSGELSTVQRILAMCRRRELFSLLLPVVAALLSALLHDNDSAIAELKRIGGQENIIRETFSDEWGVVARQVRALLQGWRTYLALAVVYVFPPALCAGLWAWAMRRSGYSMFHRAWLDTAVAVLATIAPLSFLLVAFDLSRLMAWAYLAFVVVAVFWLTWARPTGDFRPAPIWLSTVAPLVLAALFWTSPTVYAWADMSHLIRCERFCFKERTPQGRAFDLFRRRAIASPIWEFTAPGGLLPGTTGHNERDADSEVWRRVARAGRDEPGSVMSVNVVLNDADAGVTVRARAQTQRAIIGGGPHRISIAYRAEGTDNSNAETRFFIYDGTLAIQHEVLRAPLPASQTEFAATITPPPELSGNLFHWVIVYNGSGVFDLRQVSFVKVGQAR